LATRYECPLTEWRIRGMSVPRVNLVTSEQLSTRAQLHAVGLPNIDIIQHVLSIVQLVDVATVFDALCLTGVVVPAAGPFRCFFRGIELDIWGIGYLRVRLGSVARRAEDLVGEEAGR